MGVVGAMLGIRIARRGRRTGRSRLLPVLVRPVHRLLGRLRGSPGARRARDPLRRPGLTDAPGLDGSPRRDGARVHALLRPASRRGRP